MPLTFGSLFSGIGGIDLGFEWAGMECLWQVENDSYCNQILAKHWPDVPRYGSIEGISGANLPTPDVICGGFPCQPVSHAGRRQGRRDSRWLWPEMARMVDEVRPAYVVVENVPGLLSKGGSEVLADLATMGFDAEWGVVSARDAGAPHVRERIWIVAYPKGAGARVEGRQPSDQGGGGADGGREGLQEGHDDAPDVGTGTGGGGTGEDMAYPQVRHLRTGLRQGGKEKVRNGRFGNGRRALSWERDPADDPQSRMGRVVDGFPGRVDRLKALGNAVVPAVAELVARRVVEIAYLSH